MRKRFTVAGLSLVLAATAMAQTAANPDSYAFPSPWNPAGKPSSEITQFIAITWDDNQYSGMPRSGYEPKAGATFKEWNFVEGLNPDTAAAGWNDGTRPNTLSITEKGANKIGMNWAVENLDVPMTFNMITGVYVNVFTDKTEDKWNTNTAGYMGWQNGETVIGWTSGEDMGTPLGPLTGDAEKGYDGTGYRKVPIAWGREYRSETGSGVAQLNTIQQITQKAITKGHEIGNHTIDHMETNSVLPGGSHKDASKGFGRWGGKGFANPKPGGQPGEEEMPWGITIDQTKEYGTSGAALTMGWAVNVGRWMDQATWEGYITLSEEWLTRSNSGDAQNGGKEGGLGLAKSNIHGFRAPRLEVNSNLYYALKKLGYKYDCGLEEGYESHVNGQNFLWPYTTDNGVRNSWTKTMIGERVFLDTMPQGVWQLPVNCLIVPSDIRASVVANWDAINEKLPTYTGARHTPANEWDGKVTGFDFNAWILYGMTKENFKKTMENTLNLRLTGNRAPFQYGAHTDYYTPIYDNGTLLKDFNRPNYGQTIDKSWNDYKTRQTATEEFVTWAKSQPRVRFVTGKQLIDSVAAMSKDNWNRAQTEKPLSNNLFVLHENGSAKSGSLADYQNTELMAPADRDNPENRPSFVYFFNAGEMTGMTHIELNYKSRTATAVRLIMSGDKPTREVILAHRYSPIGHYDGRPSNSYESGTLRHSGRIPLTSFDFEMGYEGIRNYSSINPADIVGIEIVPLAPDSKLVPYGEVTDTDWWNNRKWRTDPFALKFQIQDVKVWTGQGWNYTEPDQTHLTKVKSNARLLSLAGITGNALKLNIAQSGKYNISVFSANGRLLQSFNAQSLSVGVNTLKLNNLAKGVYMIKVQGIDTKQQLTKSALVM